LPERLSRRPLGSRGPCDATALQERLEVRAAHAHAPADVQRRERALVDPVPDRLLVELQHGRDFRNRQELIAAPAHPIFTLRGCAMFTTEASPGRGGSAGTGAALGSCRSDRPYGNVAIRVTMGTLGLCR